MRGEQSHGVIGEHAVGAAAVSHYLDIGGQLRQPVRELLNDGLAWGLFPVLFAASGLSVTRIGVLAALYPAVWGARQLVIGALSDRTGRKPLIVGGMLLQASALALVAAAATFEVWVVAAVALGAATALVNPGPVGPINGARRYETGHPNSVPPT